MHAVTRIAFVCAAAVVLALVLRVLLPQLPGVFLMGKRSGVVFPLNRIAFWVCLILGIALALVLLGRRMLEDLGLR